MAVAADAVDLLPAARALAQHLALPLLRQEDPWPRHVLVVTANRLELRTPAFPGETPVTVAWLQGRLAHRCRAGGRESLARAVGLPPAAQPVVVDATAGLGTDAFILAHLGYHPILVERHPVMVALLTDAIQRASQMPELAATVRRMTLFAGDARDMLARLPAVDVVVLDPMFPEEKRKAAPKKEMKRLRTLLGDDPDAPELLATALQVARQRVIVKRGRSAMPVAGPAPHFHLAGKSTRLDIYLTQKKPP